MINFLQATFSEIHPDESYYWMYSRYMEWGFFDHPPMIASWIWLGTKLFAFETGVRLLTTFAQPVSLVFLWKTLRIEEPTKQHLWIFIGIAASMVMFQVYGFIAVPDGPLLLFCSIFLWLYQKFLDKNSLVITIGLMLVMAGICYSKYQGALFILFVILSNIRLLINPAFVAAGVGALILYLPHILWQVENQFPSLHYHLVARAHSTRLVDILDYIPNQLLVFNVVILIPLLIWRWRTKAQTPFDRANKTLIFGFLIFFSFTTVRGHVEPHWTVAATVPMILFAFQYVLKNEASLEFVKRWVFPTIGLILIARVCIVFDILPSDTKFHGGKEWAQQIKEKAEGRPVVFTDSWQSPSIYSFYTRLPATTLNTVFKRQDQYDIWQFERDWIDEEVLAITRLKDSLAIKEKLRFNRTQFVRVMPGFTPTQRLKLEFSLPSDISFRPGALWTIPVKVWNDYDKPIGLENQYWPVDITGVFISNEIETTLPGKWKTGRTLIPSKQWVSDTIEIRVPFFIKSGEYKFSLAFKSGNIQESYSSTPVNVILPKD